MNDDKIYSVYTSVVRQTHFWYFVIQKQRISTASQYSRGPRQFFQDFDLQSLVWPTRWLPCHCLARSRWCRKFTFKCMFYHQTICPREKDGFPRVVYFWWWWPSWPKYRLLLSHWRLVKKREYHCIARPWKQCYKTLIIICDRKIKK